MAKITKEHVKCDLCGGEMDSSQRRPFAQIAGEWQPLRVDVCQRCGEIIEKAQEHGIVSGVVEWCWLDPLFAYA